MFVHAGYGGKFRTIFEAEHADLGEILAQKV